MKRSHCDGGIDQRGEGVYRLRYRVGGKRFTKTFKGTLTEARKELRKLLKSGDDGEHVDPSKKTLSAWVDEWIALKAAERQHRTVFRYEDLLKKHVLPNWESDRSSKSNRSKSRSSTPRCHLLRQGHVTTSARF